MSTEEDPPSNLPAGDGGGETKRKFDLEERTAVFGENVIELLKTVPESALTRRIIDQLVGSSGSVAANYCEADDAVSKRDFRNKIGTCRKESRESKMWLRLLAKAHPPARDQARVLWREAKELNLIFSEIWRQCGPEDEK